MAEKLDAAATKDAFYLATGKAIRVWANLEMALSWYLAVLLNTDQFRARVVWMSLPNLRARRALLIRLAETFLDDQFLPEFRRLLRRVKTLAGKRNLLAHSLINDEGIAPFEFCADKEDEHAGVDFAHRESYSLNNVADWSRAMEALRKDLLDWIEKTYTHASPKMHRAPRSDPMSTSDPLGPTTPEAP